MKNNLFRSLLCVVLLLAVMLAAGFGVNALTAEAVLRAARSVTAQ